MAFEKNNKYAQEWTLENAQPRFEDALKYATDNEECLCLQDAIYESGIPSRTFYYLSGNHDVLQIIKEDIHNRIISRINKNALDKVLPAPASPSIWRMKQLGEKDEQHIKQTGTMEQKVIVTDQKTSEAVQEMIDKFKNEKS